MTPAGSSRRSQREIGAISGTSAGIGARLGRQSQADEHRRAPRRRCRAVPRPGSPGSSGHRDAPADLEARVDPVRIRQAVANLIDNALRHGRGSVSVRARGDGAQLVLSVADQGSGFSSEFVERAFERFSRADPSRGRGGAGLGLAIVRSIARAHDGAVSVESGDRGAVVALRLPVGRAQCWAVERSPAPERSPRMDTRSGSDFGCRVGRKRVPYRVPKCADQWGAKRRRALRAADASEPSIGPHPHPVGSSIRRGTRGQPTLTALASRAAAERRLRGAGRAGSSRQAQGTSY